MRGSRREDTVADHAAAAMVEIEHRAKLKSTPQARSSDASY